MSWKLMSKPKLVKVSRSFAKEFADLDPCPHDRALSERRLGVYRSLFQQGLFRPCTWAKAFCQETNGWYRVNGKHTSTLLSILDTIPEFYVTVEEYECATLNDVARLYSTFDSKLQSRSTRDINLSFAATVPEISHVSARTINLAVTGMAWHQWGDSYSGKQAAERAEALLEHTDFVLWLEGLIGRPGYVVEGRKSSGHLQRGAVVAAMMATWLKAHEKATLFWTAVRDETGEKNTLPDRKLARWLLTVGTSNPGVRKEKTADNRELYSRCVTAWNAWRKNESTNLNYYSDKELPKAM